MLFELGLGATGETFLNAGQQRIATALAVHYCPSRRRARLFPNTKVRLKPYTHYGVARPSEVAKSDYAANLGDPERTCCPGYAPWDLASGDDPGIYWPDITATNRETHTGISFNHSTVQLQEITDGTSCTYMVGEKHVNQRLYENGGSSGDDGTIYASHNSDTHRSTYYSPQPDGNQSDTEDHYQIFGSAHPGGFHMAMCDGSVRNMSYSMDATIHRALGTRSGQELLHFSN